MSEVLIHIEDDLSDQERQFIEESLGDYDVGRAPEWDQWDLDIVARVDGKVVAGLLGHTHWNWLYVKILWVAEEMRGRGLGRRLMLAAEDEARRRGCLHAHCNTFGFQALPFYEKLGYTVFGKLEDYPPGDARYFLQKRNLRDAVKV